MTNHFTEPLVDNQLSLPLAQPANTPSDPPAKKKRAPRKTAAKKTTTSDPNAAMTAIATTWEQKFPDLSAIVVNDEAQWLYAADVQADLKKDIKAIEEERLGFTRGLDDSKKKMIAAEKRAKAPLEAIYDKIAEERKKWREAEEARLAALQQEQEAARRETNEQHAAITGQTLEQVEAMMPPPPPTTTLPTTIYTGNGGIISTRRYPKWRLIAGATPPWSHRGVCLYKLDEAAITQLRRAAGEDLNQAPPGIEFYYETGDSIRG